MSEMDDDPDVTPKARPSTRTASAGAFLKSELYQRNQDIDSTRFSVRGNRHPIFTPQPSSRRSPSPNKASPPKIPDRRPSKSSNFFLRAIGGRLSDESKAIRRKDSGASRGTLIRRLSRSKNSSSAESYTDSITSTDSSNTFEPGSLDITDVSIDSRLSSYEGNPPSSTISDVLPPDVFVLWPQIVITPEISSVDTGCCFLWVAIEVTGILQKADGYEARYDGPRLPSSHVSGMSIPAPTPHTLITIRPRGLWTSTFYAYRPPSRARLPCIRDYWGPSQKQDHPSRRNPTNSRQDQIQQTYCSESFERVVIRWPHCSTRERSR